MTGVEASVGVERKRPIDELRDNAKRAMAEHADVMAALETALSNRQDAEQKLEAIRGIIAQDVTAFREIAGVTDVRKERLIGFASGVCASVLASALWSWGPLVFHWIRSLFA